MRPAIVVAVALVSCSRTRAYDTRATYEAPKTGLRVIVESVGVVPPGEDLGAAPINVLVCPLSGGTAHELRVDVPAYSTHPRTAVVRDGSRSTPVPWREPKTAFALELASAGYTPDAAEVDELVDVIDGVGEGPKATRMPKQTRALSVVSVDFAGPRAFARCTP